MTRDIQVWASDACTLCPTLRRIVRGLEALAPLDPDADDVEDLAALACGGCSLKRPSLNLDQAGRLVLELEPMIVTKPKL